MQKLFFLPQILFTTFVLFLTGNSHSQALCKTNLSKGQVLHYVRTDSPDPLFIVPNYAILKGKKKQAADEQFRKDVAAGKYVGKDYEFEMSISDVSVKNNGIIYELEYATPQTKYHSYGVCKGDTLFGIKSKTPNPLPGSNNDTIGFQILGITQYPLNMKVGDVLPPTTDLFYTFPKDVDMSYKKQVLDHVTTTTSTWQDRDYIYTRTSTQSYFKDVNMTLKYTLQFSAPTVTYRHVIGEDEVIVNGKPYKAYKIELSLETKLDDMITNVDADEKMMKWSLEFTNKFIVNKANKAESLKNGGMEWFVPELGLITTSEIYNSSGDPLYRTHIKSIK